MTAAALFRAHAQLFDPGNVIAEANLSVGGEVVGLECAAILEFPFQLPHLGASRVGDRACVGLSVGGDIEFGIE